MCGRFHTMGFAWAATGVGVEAPAAVSASTTRASVFQASDLVIGLLDALFTELAGRGVAVVGRGLEILVLLVGPELRDVRIGVDHCVLELAPHALHLANVDVLDGVVQL